MRPRPSLAPLLLCLLASCGVPRPELVAPGPAVRAETLPEPASPGDVPGLARDLGIEARRGRATRLLSERYERVLIAAQGERSAAEPQQLVEASVDALLAAYATEMSADRAGEVLELLVEMRTPRAWPAIERALDWREGASEEHAVRAAQCLQSGAMASVPAQARARALAAALERVTGQRPLANRMRIELIRALGRAADRRSVDALARVVESFDHNFVLNRLAGEELGRLADPRAVPVLVRALFVCAPDAPQLRMNDVAAMALVRIGRPALAPLLELLAGRNGEASTTAHAYIEAVRRVSPEAAAQMNAEALVAGEAGWALGQLGYVEALDPLLAETRHPSGERRMMGVLSAVSLLGLSDAQRAQLREAILRVYAAADAAPQMLQLIVASRHTYDPGLLPFLAGLARAPDAELPDRRIRAARAYALLADADEAGELRRIIAAEPTSTSGGYREVLEASVPALEAAARCDHDVACWLGLIASEQPLEVRKALVMLVRLDAREAQVRESVIGLLGHRDIEVRFEALYAVDALTEGPDPALVAAIDALRDAEEGRSSWNQIQGLAQAVRARHSIGRDPTSTR